MRRAQTRGRPTTRHLHPTRLRSRTPTLPARRPRTRPCLRLCVVNLTNSNQTTSCHSVEADLTRRATCCLVADSATQTNATYCSTNGQRTDAAVACHYDKQTGAPRMDGTTTTSRPGERRKPYRGGGGRPLTHPRPTSQTFGIPPRTPSPLGRPRDGTRRAPRGVAESPPSLPDTVRLAVSAMTWLTPSDRPLVEVAVRYAQAIEDAAGDVKAVGWIGPHLVNVLKALGGAPAERKALGVEEVVRGRLAELRLARR